MPVNSVVPKAASSADQDNSVVLTSGEGKSVSPTSRLRLREAIKTCGCKQEAVAAALGVKAAYLSRMLAGEKPITLEHIDALPEDVGAAYARLSAEHNGLFVVPPAHERDAARFFVAGILGLFALRQAS